ncbi:esterase B1-like [Macrosteles quadrilineatus]|uniref:esterase B1-like n=1 Tax=Macrosteles quadrilineatus TaxID=74068 RepID=UPI0023E33934|nr:esterase B1-like [Macrosteles quadrilineatus]
MEEQIETVLIETKLGTLKGRTQTSAFDGEKYYSFRGIPYGKPPVGELRFKAPLPYGGWTGVRDALEDGHDPKQRLLLRLPGTDPNKETDGEEDCLYLNIYIKQLPEKSGLKKPVMVHIHGGGFAGGSGGSKAAGPDYFITEDIVLVSLNYRCGAFGFLSFENEEVPGNAGLKDQTLALRWVQDNIDSFGGDSNNVTIFGISAGGASVQYHLLSPLSKGLFHKAIIQSGFCQDPWAFQPSPKKVGMKLAKTLGCTSDDPHEVFEFLKSIPSDDIVKATEVFIKDEDYIMLVGLVFSPCVEVAGDDKFLPDTPTNLMKRGEYNKVPTILGVCENEGSVSALFIMMYKLSFDLLPNAMNAKPEILVPPSLGIKLGSEEHKKVQDAIKEFYFKGKAVKNIEELLAFESDYLFNVGLGDTRRYLLSNSSQPVYSYLFTNHKNCYCQLFASMMGPDNPMAALLSRSETCHAADFMYLFRTTSFLSLPELTDEHREGISKHVKAWTSFARTGNPNVAECGVRWTPDSQSSPCYMDIGTDWTVKEGMPFADRINFWLQIADKYC